MADETVQAPDTTTDANGSGNAGETTASSDEKKFTQADVDRIFADRLKRERDKAAADAAKVAASAEEARRAKAGEWETLAATREHRIKDLEASQAQMDAERTALHERLNKHVTAQMKGWPDAFKALVPRSDDALERWDAYERAQAAVAEVMPQSGSLPVRQPGTGPTPRPSGGAGPNSASEAEYLRLKGTGKYSPM